MDFVYDNSTLKNYHKSSFSLIFFLESYLTQQNKKHKIKNKLLRDF